MKSWHLFLLIAAMFNIAQYVMMVGPYPVVAAWLMLPVALFSALAAWSAWYESRRS